MFRLLLDPAADAAGGSATTTPAAAPTPTAAQQQPTTPPPTPAPAPVEIRLSLADYQRLNQAAIKLGERDAADQQALQQKESERLLALAQKGEAEKALRLLGDSKDAEIKAQRDRGDALEQSILASTKNGAIADALLGKTFVSAAAAAQVKDLLGRQFEAARDAAGQVVVRQVGTLKPVAEVAEAWLASDEGRHHLKATTTGGAGASGANATTPTPTPGDASKLALDEQLVLQLRARMATAPAHPYALGIGRPASN